MHEIPEKWRVRVREHLKQHVGVEREHLSAGDFRTHLLLHFPDGSFVFLRYAFYVVDREEMKIAVFTEHCGYHVFPFGGVTVETLSSEWKDIS